MKNFTVLFDDPVGEENAVEVVDLVLGVGGGHVFSLLGVLDEFVAISGLFRGLVSQGDRVGPVDETPDFGDRQTAFEPAVLFLFVNLGEGFFAGGNDLGVDEDTDVVSFLIEEDKEAFVEADLGGGEADPLGIDGFLEDFGHFFDLFFGFFIPGIDRFGFVLEEGAGDGQNLHRFILPLTYSISN